jgi:protein-disulfide isomerase
LVAARKRFGDSLALVFVHNPLTIHKYAAQAAAAAECADAQGSFAEFVSAVYRRQDSLGHKSWNSYAKDAGVQDTARFTECLQSEPAVRISRGIAISKALNVQATPTIFINGWRFSGAPNSEALEEAIRRALLREPLGSSSGWFEKLRSTRSVRGD